MAHEAVGSTKAGAPSKLNCPTSVPTTSSTLTAVRIAEPLYACGTHATAVADVHALQPHTSPMASEAVTVRLALPKLSPLIVTVPPPLGTALAETVLTTGAAYETSTAFLGLMPDTTRAAASSEEQVGLRPSWVSRQRTHRRR